MTIDYLTYFYETVEQGSITQAAKKINISNSAISQAIGHLERELGIILFHRRHGKLILTAEGEQLLPQVKKILKEVEQLHSHAREIREGPEKVIRIGTVPGVSQALLETIAELSKVDNGLQWIVSEIDMEDILRLTQNGKLNLGIVAFSEQLKINYRQLASQSLVKSELVVVARKSYFANQRVAMSISEIIKEPLIMYQDRFNQSIVNDLRKENPEINVKLWSNNLEMIWQFIEEGQGVSVMPRHLLAAKKPQAELMVLEVLDLNYPQTYLWGIHSGTQPLTTLEYQLLSELEIKLQAYFA